MSFKTCVDANSTEQYFLHKSCVELCEAILVISDKIYSLAEIKS
jgi:hypothetical protein